MRTDRSHATTEPGIPTWELYEVETRETVSPQRVVTATFCVVATSHDEAVGAVQADVPMEKGGNSRMFQVKKSSERHRAVVWYSFSDSRHDSPTFPTDWSPAPTGERLFLVRVRVHNPELRKGRDFAHDCLTVASGYDEAVNVAKESGGPGVTFQYEVRDWPGRIYETSKLSVNPEFEDVYLMPTAARLLDKFGDGLTLRRTGEQKYQDGEGRFQKSSVINELLEFGFVHAQDDNPDELVITQKGRLYVQHLRGAT